MKKKCEFLDSKEVYQCKRFKVREDDIRLPDGSEITRELVVHPGAVMILPRLKDGRLLLLSEYRYTLRQAILEFPAGMLEPEEDPLECAQREIKEEVGYGAEKWQPLGQIYPVPGWATEVVHAYLASELFPQKLKGDADEIIDTIVLSVQEVEQAIADGQINDAKSIAIFARARYLGLL